MAKSADERPASVLIDYVAVLISPLLIMLMVGSLVFFLIDSIYAGNYPSRLSYTMFFFVIGAVLIARIGILHGRGRASLYVLGLGIAVFIAMSAYMDYPPGVMRTVGPIVSLMLIGIVWWTADKLTWDCTHLDGERDAGGQGLLAATGLKQAEVAPTTGPDEVMEEPDGKKKKKKKPVDEGFVGWVEKWKAYREKQKQKPHTPGTWVIYFGLACLPIFVLGQSLIPAEAGNRRWWAFLEMAAFVGGGLGLLVTTSLMGLKKYLEDRGAKIPGAMTAGWLGLGAALIVTFVVIGSFLPRPYSETPLVQWKSGPKQDRNASRYAQAKGGEAGKGDGAKGNKTEAGDGQSNAKGGQPGGKGKNGEAKQGQGDKQGKQGSSDNSKGNDGKGSNDQSQGNGKSDNRKNDSSQSKNEGQKKNESQSDPQKNDAQKSDGQQAQDTDQNQAQDGDEDGGSQESQIGKMFEQLGDGIKWIVWVVIAIAVIVGVIIFFLKFLAPFTAWARNLLDWLKSLFGRKPVAGGESEAAEEAAEIERPPSFDSFDNPFHDGTAQRRPLPEVISVTYRAFESWAYDHDQSKRPGETPRELAARLKEEFPQTDSFDGLTSLVTRHAYSNRPLPSDALTILERAWADMEKFAPSRA